MLFVIMFLLSCWIYSSILFRRYKILWKRGDHIGLARIRPKMYQLILAFIGVIIPCVNIVIAIIILGYYSIVKDQKIYFFKKDSKIVKSVKSFFNKEF